MGLDLLDVLIHLETMQVDVLGGSLNGLIVQYLLVHPQGKVDYMLTLDVQIRKAVCVGRYVPPIDARRGPQGSRTKDHHLHQRSRPRGNQHGHATSLKKELPIVCRGPSQRTVAFVAYRANRGIDQNQ